MPKHQTISRHLEASIASGRLPPGARVPSENELAHRFRVSRPTVARAFRDLEARGLVERRPGSGTYVSAPDAAGGRTFGLLIPGLGDTEIFEPICAAIAGELRRSRDRLLWASAGRPGEAPAAQAEALAESCLEQEVDGVFFAPVELSPDSEAVNDRVLARLAAAGRAVVLLDRDTTRAPARSPHDLVSVDHRRAGYLLAAHLVACGHDRVDFLARPHSAVSVQARIAGYREALLDAGLSPRPGWIHVGDPGDEAFVRALVDGGARALVCANDVTAGQALHTLDALGRAVPGEVRVAGFDDVKYASLLRVPLTTVRQPCAAIGVAAVAAMHERLARPHLPPREILLPPALVVRRSCGAAAAGPA